MFEVDDPDVSPVEYHFELQKGTVLTFSLPPSCAWVKELLIETCFEFNLSAAFTGKSAYTLCQTL